MSVHSMMARIQAAKAEYDKALAAAGGEVREEIAKSLGALIPEGWRLVWHQSDDQYNDENYFFGFSYARLVSDKLPREGKLLKEAVARKTERRNGPWGYEEHTVVYPEPAVYEQIFDDQCQERELDDHGGWEDDGCIQLSDLKYQENSLTALGFTQAQLRPLVDAWESLDINMMQNAFGRMSAVTVLRDGTFKIDNKRGGRY